MRDKKIDPVDQYIEALYAHEDDGLKSVRARLVKAERWGVNIGANEGRLLQVLMKLSGVSNALEIGTLYGYSSTWIARALPEGGHLYTIERDPLCAQQARQTFADCKIESRVTLLEGEALEQLEVAKEHGPFDMIFIDANKSSYFEYLRWAEDNLKIGGLLVADNTLLGGHVISPSQPETLSKRQWTEVRRFNQELAKTSKFEATMLATPEGMTVAVRV
jgi:predicted O-methyltransferase YrrM